MINYTPPDTINTFIKDYIPGELFYDWVVGRSARARPPASS
jgi:hypothetical protein